MLDSCGMSCENFGKTIIGWANSPNTPDTITLGAQNRKYPSDVQNEIDHLVNDKGWTINGTIGTCAPLPITLIRFTAEPTGELVLLTWETAWEENSDYYRILRSTDGKSWESIGRIKAGGNRYKNSYYEFIDYHPSARNYYRLKEVDIDGKVTFSEIRLVVFRRSEESLVSIFPNPSNGHLTILADKGASYTIYNSIGQVIKRGTLNVELGSTEVNLSGATPGIYFLKVRDNAVKMVLQ